MKKEDFLSRIGFFPSLLLVYISSRTGNENYYTRIDKNVVLGAIPTTKILQKAYKEENVRGVLSVVNDWEIAIIKANYTALNLKHLQLKTVEYTAPTMDDIQLGLDFINSVAEQDQGVTYIHCKAGRSRSATMTACYLIKTYNMKTDSAIKYIKYQRNQIQIGKVERAMVEKCYEKYANKSAPENVPETTPKI